MTATPIYDAIVEARWGAYSPFWMIHDVLRVRVARAAGEITDDTPEQYR